MSEKLSFLPYLDVCGCYNNMSMKWYLYKHSSYSHFFAGLKYSRWDEKDTALVKRYFSSYYKEEAMKQLAGEIFLQ